MPSVFNHDNSCWGVKRSFCNVFQDELQEDMHNSKLPELGILPNSFCPPVNNSINYSVSSNGYYGYQPHSVPNDKINDANNCDCKQIEVDECAMDFEDNPNTLCPDVHVPTDNNCMINCNIIDSPQLQNCKRKRHLPHTDEDITKKMRQEEPAETDPKLPTHVNYRRECDTHSKCLMSHFI